MWRRRPTGGSRERWYTLSSVPADPACVALQVNYVVIFAAVYGLSDADIATIGVTATQLRHALGLSNVELGALASVATGVGALATLPAGILADRVNRVRLLAGAVALWAAAIVLSAFATSFPMLVGTRVLLGGLLAVAGPTTATLLGDVWPAADRGRIYGLITSGELIGAGVGFVLSGELAAVSWRLAFLALALPAAILAVRIRRLPEPKRTVRRIPTTTGTLGFDGSRAPDGDPGIVCTTPALSDALPTASASGSPGPPVVAAADDDPVPGPGSSWQVLLYVLSIPTNVVLIVAEAFSYFFLNSVEAFGEEFAKGRYHLSQAVVTLVLLVIGVGAVLGATLSGHASDKLVRRGYRKGRITVATCATVLAALVFVPALLTHNLLIAIPVLTVGGFGLAATNPPLDATRLEVVQSSVWGRAEAVRTFVQTGFLAAAPITFGLLADHLAGGGHRGLQAAFLVMPAPLLLSGLLLLAARRTYQQDRDRGWHDDHRAAVVAQKAP